jgi:hypothetical protein
MQLSIERAVGADDGAHLVLTHVEADVGERLHPAEAQADVLDVEDDVADLLVLAHAALRTAGKVLASTIFSVADTLPLRPSSNFTAVSMNCSAQPSVQGIDQHLVLVGDEAALDLAGAGHLAVVGVQLLVQHQEAAHLAARQQAVGGQVGVDLLDALADQLQHLGLAGQVGVAGVGQVAPLGPVAHRFDVDVDEGADLLAAVAEGHRLLDVKGKNFSLFSTYLGANIAPSLAPPWRPTSLARSMIFRCPLASRKPASPVWYQPSAVSTSAVASGFL